MYYLSSTQQAIAVKSAPYTNRGYVHYTQRKQKESQQQQPAHTRPCFYEIQSQKEDKRAHEEQDESGVSSPTPCSPLDVDPQKAARETIRSYKRKQLVQQMKRQESEKQQEEAKLYQLLKQRDHDEKEKQRERRNLKGSQQKKMMKGNEEESSFAATVTSYLQKRRLPNRTAEKSTTTTKLTQVTPESRPQQGQRILRSIPRKNLTDQPLASCKVNNDDNNSDEMSMIPLSSMDGRDNEECADDDALQKFLCDNLDHYTVVSPKTTTSKRPSSSRSPTTDNLRKTRHCHSWLKSAPTPIEPWQVRGKEDVQLLLQLFSSESDKMDNNVKVIDSPLSTTGKSRTQEDIETWMDQGYSMQAIVIQLTKRQEPNQG